MRQFFKYLNRFMVLHWRLGVGNWLSAWPTVGGRYMVLVHTGRKSGVRRYTPLNFALVDGAVYCTAGFGAKSDWYRNILANPQVEVWLPDGWWAGTVEEVADTPERMPLMREVLIGSGFAAWLAGVWHWTLSDEDLAALTVGYRLVRIRLTAARTGPDGPGSLVWVWPVLTGAAVLLALAGWRRRCGGR